jgi:hypothetical protein
MALNYVGSRHGAERNLESVIINNSTTVTVGDVVEAYTNGYLTNGTAAVPIKGVVHAIVEGSANQNKSSLPPIQGANVAGTAISPATNAVTTAADNTTTGKYWAIIDTSNHSLYSAEVNGTLGTTNSSNLLGAKIDVDSANSDYGRLLETTATRTVGTPANFYSHGVDPQDSTRLIVSIALSEEDSVYE